MATHVATNVKMGTYLSPMITYGDDPLKAYEEDMKPSAPQGTDAVDDKKVFEYKEELKIYLQGKKY